MDNVNNPEHYNIGDIEVIDFIDSWNLNFNLGNVIKYVVRCDYKDDKNASFRVFAELCVTRQIITAIKTATRQKHMPLNSYVSLDKPVYEDDSEKTLVETMVGPAATEPEEIILQQEQQDYIELKMSEVLSELEQRVLALYLEGQSYSEISEQLDRHVKSIDNALQRVKRKLGQHIEVTEILR